MPTHAPDQPAAPFESVAFLRGLAALCGLPAEAAQRWSQGLPVPAPGLPCRVQLAGGEGSPLRARIEVLLPLTAQELAGDEVARLLAVQTSLFAEARWWLGLSPEGLLQIASLDWHDRPALAQAALDMGQSLAPTVVRALIGEAAT